MTKMADEYITRYDAETAIAEIYSSYGKDGSGDTISREDAMSEIREIPAADVEPVVRCEDCVHYDKGENDSESWMYCKVLAKDVYDGFYCKLGERREVQDG